jgi:hypothetical protein
MRAPWLALSVGLLVVSCDDVNVHILSGQQYTPASATLPGCIAASAGVDVVAGQSTGDNCSPECVYLSQGTLTAVYVTTVCPPYPGDYTTEELDAASSDADPCFGALAAYNAYEADGYTCFPEPEAGAPEGDAGDAGDAGTSDAADGGTVGDATME